VTLTEELAAPAAGTTVPTELPTTTDETLPRPLRARTFDDHACLAGSAAGSLALTWLLWRYLLPFDGLLGFVVGWYVLFVLMYLGTTALTNPLPVVRDRLASALVQAGATVTGLALVSVIVFPFRRGYHALFHVNFFTKDMGGVGAHDPFDRGGVLHAIVGTLLEIGIAVAVALPLGIGAAVYMSEVGGAFARVVRTIVEAMTALPSVVAGLFVYAVVIVRFHLSPGGLAAASALTIMILPIIARASDVVLRVVPGGLREASLALGSSRWRTVWSVVLPTVRPGLATAVILGIARGVGETSPVLLTSGATDHLNGNPFDGQLMNSLPLQTYEAVRSGDVIFIQRGMATACVLLLLVLTLFVMARVIARPRVR
jgi:phosphate transport system permease protein